MNVAEFKSIHHFTFNIFSIHIQFRFLFTLFFCIIFTFCSVDKLIDARKSLIKMLIKYEISDFFTLLYAPP